jgi:serine/threonine-protein kinase
VLRALEKLPADRFASAGAFGAALGDPAGGGARRTGARPDGRPQRKASRAMVLALIGGGMLLAGVIGATVLRGDRVSAAATARVRVQLPAGEELRSGTFPNLTTPPDATGFLYHGPGLNTRTQLWFRRWDELQGRRLSQSLAESCCATYSPSGDTVAYLSAPRQLNLLPLTGGLPLAFPDLGLLSMTDLGGGLDWGTDGNLYAIAPEGLLRIDVSRAAKQVVAAPDSARGDMGFLWPEVLPGAKGAIVTVFRREAPSDPERASIGIADFSTGRVEILVPGVRAIYSPTGHLIVARTNGVLWALPFDAGALRAGGAAIELRDTVALRFGNASPGIVDIDLDAAGNLSYIAGRDGAYHLVSVDRAGAWRPLGEQSASPALDAMDISPDGQRIATALAGADLHLHLWVQPLAGGPRVRLTFDGNANTGPRWRPGTGSITWNSDRESPGSILLRLHERDAAGRGQPRRLAIGDPRAVGGHSWSPDGRWLVFRTDDQEPGAGDIMGIRPGTDSVARALVATPAEELAPAVSPDGRWLAYTSNASGRREVYVSPFPETADGRYQISTTGGMSPVWGPGGRELVFVDDAQRMVSVPVVPGGAFQAGAPQVLFQVEDYYVAPFRPQFALTSDGRHFIMARREGGASFSMVVVFNFVEELRRRVAAR